MRRILDLGTFVLSNTFGELNSSTYFKALTIITVNLKNLPTNCAGSVWLWWASRALLIQNSWWEILTKDQKERTTWSLPRKWVTVALKGYSRTLWNGLAFYHLLFGSLRIGVLCEGSWEMSSHQGHWPKMTYRWREKRKIRIFGRLIYTGETQKFLWKLIRFLKDKERSSYPCVVAT